MAFLFTVFDDTKMKSEVGEKDRCPVRDSGLFHIHNSAKYQTPEAIHLYCWCSLTDVVVVLVTYTGHD
jgi:hypothetical protein